MKKIAIIGGKGFIGTRLSQRLSSNKKLFDIYDIDSQLIGTKNWLDVRKIETLDSLKGADTLINLAAEHKDNIKPVSRYDETNVKGAENICTIATKYNINEIIFTSSVAVYGFAPSNTGEDGEINYFNDYGRTKYLAEKVYLKWQKEDPQNRKLTIIRPTVVFGEGNRGNVFNLLKQIQSKKFLMIGDGKNIKSMAYVENVAAFLEYSLEFKKNLSIYNYIDKPDMNMNELISLTRNILFDKNNTGLRLPKVLGLAVGYLVDIFQNFSNYEFPISSIRIKKFLSTSQFSTSVEDTGFRRPVSMENAFKKTIRYEFFEDNRDKEVFFTE